MPIQSIDALTNAITSGRTFRNDWTKNFNPTVAAVSWECHLLARWAGNPTADTIFDAGTNLAFQPVTFNTTGAGSHPAGDDVQIDGFTKHLLNAMAVTVSGTVVPNILYLIDIVWFYRVTSVTTITAQATTNTLGLNATFTADAPSDICTYTSTASRPSNLLTGTRVQLTTTGTLPAGLALATDYWLIRMSNSTFELASSYANAIAGTQINITDAGTGTHTVNWLLPRYTNGDGLNALIFNPSATALGAGTPNLSLGYRNSTGVSGRATPWVLPIGKTAAWNQTILYSGVGNGKYNFSMPRQGADSGIAQVDTITNSTSYVSGSYTVALYKLITTLPVQVLGAPAERNTLTDNPSLPRIYDGAALYLVSQSSAATPANSGFNWYFDFVWN